MTVLHLDFETASLLDLSKVGTSRYSRDPSTVVTCMAWAFDDGPVRSAILPLILPDEVERHLRQWGAYHAWNAAFETAIIRNVFDFHPSTAEQASCTMQRALHAGLPASLAEAGPALGLASVKDKTARSLMLQMSKPKKDGAWWHQTDQDKLEALAAYCEKDVIAERAIGKVIPELPEREKFVSRLDAETNERGFCVDQPLVHRLIKIANAETALLNAEIEALTDGYVTSAGTQHQRLTEWLRNEGVAISGVGKEPVAAALEHGLAAHVVKVLRIRQQIAKSSVLKLKAMLNTVDNDGRCRGTLAYYGAARTGRFSGRLTQPQNFPRPEEYANDAINAINGYDFDGDALRLFFDEPLSVAASCLRGCLVPSPGSVFFCYDFSQIEARILAWLAQQNDVLKAVRSGIDIYEYAVTKMGLSGRKAGKAVTLSLGYGMGATKFADRAKTYGLSPSLAESQIMVDTWRRTNDRIVAYWAQVEAAAKRAIKIGMVGPFQVTKARNGQPLMTIMLPSGRRLFYRNIRLEPDPDRRGREAIAYDGVDQDTKRWGTVRTYGAKLVENITQATARDVLVEAALRMHGGAARLVLSVHDELLFEVDPSEIARLNDEMDLQDAFRAGKAAIETPPTWAEDLPIEATGGVLARYGKA